MNVVAAVVSGTEASELMKPGQRSFDHPAKDAQSAAVFRVALGENRFDVSLAKQFTMRLRIIATIGLYAVRASPRPAALSTDWPNAIDQGDQLRDIVSVSAGQNGC